MQRLQDNYVNSMTEIIFPTQRLTGSKLETFNRPVCLRHNISYQQKLSSPGIQRSEGCHASFLSSEILEAILQRLEQQHTEVLVSSCTFT
jgi:hypothetical protein